MPSGILSRDRNSNEKENGTAVLVFGSFQSEREIYFLGILITASSIDMSRKIFAYAFLRLENTALKSNPVEN